MDLHLIGASALARRIKDGEVTAEAALEHFIDRIERLDGALNAVVVRRFEQARERAREADRALARGEDWGALLAQTVAHRSATKPYCQNY